MSFTSTSFLTKKNMHQYITNKPIPLLFRKDRPTSPTDLQNGSDYNGTTIHQFRETYQYSPKSPTQNGSASPTVYYGGSRRSSVHSNNEPPHEVSPVHVKFVRDTSKYWYKPNISRDEGEIFSESFHRLNFILLVIYILWCSTTTNS